VCITSKKHNNNWNELRPKDKYTTRLDFTEITTKTVLSANYLAKACCTQNKLFLQKKNYDIKQPKTANPEPG